MRVQSLILPLLSGALLLASVAAAPLRDGPDGDGVVAADPPPGDPSGAGAGEAPASSPVPIRGETLLLRAARVIVRPGREIADAEILVQNGRIVAVGAGLAAPPGARVLEGEVVCAGFLDPWSSLGIEPGSAGDLSTTPATAAVDGVDPYDPAEGRREALRGGVTCARVQAGGPAQVGGVGAVVRTAERLAATPGELVVLGDACLSATIGVTRGGRLLDVFERVGEVERLVGQIERGRAYRESWVEHRHDLEEWEKKIAEEAAKLEKDFKKAKKDREKEQKEAAEKDKEFKEKKYKEDRKPRAPKHDADAEVLARAAEGEIPLVVEVHRAEEIRALLAKTAAFDRLRLVIAGGTEAAAHAAELAKRRIPVIVWPAPGLGERPDEYDGHDLALAGELGRAGVQVLIGSGGGPHARDLRNLAALAAGHGLDPAAALAAITTNAARVFDVPDRLGSVERGKDAELLVLDGDPLDTTSRIRFVISHGEVVVE
ncbi:MAG: amidohydrolase family protein [Planctomycetota bacterium]